MKEMFLSFNTASGMDCMQFDGFDGIPALLAGFNTASGMDCMQCLCGGFLLVFVKFQYRKRYGLHAI